MSGLTIKTKVHFSSGRRSRKGERNANDESP